MSKVLIVDDDVLLSHSLKLYLEEQNYVVETIGDGEDALHLLRSFPYDAIILDWNLPGMSGETVCLEYRKGGGQAPIIFLTGQNDISFIERGLGVGADDYLTKPFEVLELAARLRSMFRRRRGEFEAELRAFNIVLKPELNLLVSDDTKITLRPKETAVLEYLMRNPNRIFSAQQLLDSVWSADSTATANTVRTWMGLLRQKLAQVGRETLIRTVPGAGYVLDLPD